jgi:hypothetical protein
MYGEDDVNFEEDDAEQPEESNNRTFLFAMLAIGGLVFVVLLCIVGYFVYSRMSGGTPSAEMLAQTQAAATQNIDAQVQAGLTGTSMAATAMASALPPTNTPTPSPTPVVALPTDTPDLGTPDPATATIAAALTQAAAITQTVVLTSTAIPPASAALPNSGFFDEVGLPLLGGMTLLLIAVIIVARRLRAAPVRNR